MSSPAASAPVAARAGAAPGRAAEPAREEGWSGKIRQAVQIFMLIQVAQYGVKYLFGDKLMPAKPAVPNGSGSTGTAGESASQVNQAGVPQQPQMLPLWPLGTIFDAHFFVTDSPYLTYDLDNPSMPQTTFTGLKFGDWTWKESWDVELDVPKSAQNNGSLYLSTVLVRNGSPVKPSIRGFKGEDVHFSSNPLMKYHRQIRIRTVKNLISGVGDAEAETLEEELAKDRAMPIISYYHPNVTINLVSNSGPIQINQLQPQVSQYIRSYPGQEADSPPTYFPIVFPNAFWQLKSNSYPVNATVSKLPLHVDFEPIGFTKFSIYTTLDESMRAASNNPVGGASAADMDEVKRIFLESNVWLLVVTAVVSVLHSVFELLAFKNDVTHWKNNKNQVGVSVRTIVTNVFVQLVILLYLLDNSVESSWMILLGQGMGLVIEAWKITKAVDIKLIQNPGGALPYKISITDKHVLTQEEKDTQEYDALAFKYVTWGTVPLLVGYTVYSLVYESHRGWYSFVITTLTSFVYMFGFVQLIPQLIINYKLKSVAHMPLRSLTYKALNTVVDDFFSFVIKMPTLHRIACFRDDVVFAVLLYQYYIYPTDKTRANEYGQIAEPLEKDKAEPEKEESKAKAIAAVKEESRKNR